MILREIAAIVRVAALASALLLPRGEPVSAPARKEASMTPTRAPRNPSRSTEGGRRGSAKLRTVCLSLLLLAPAFAACSAGDVPQDEASAEFHQDLAACTVTTAAAGYVGKPDYWGTITIKNTSGGAMTTPAISFKVPSGVTCDYHESGWTHTQAGSTCTYSRTSKSAIAAGASLTLHFSTDGASSFTPTGIKVSANGCSGSGGSAGKGGSSGAAGKGGASGAGAAGKGGAGGDPPGVVWNKASLTEFESYPDPGSEECVKYNGCTWAGQFAGVDGKQPESWVKAHNIAAVHSKDFAKYKLKTLRLRKDGHEIDVVVYDECADSDCSGCCTQNAKPSGNLIDLEKYTAERFGVPADGQVEWRCLDCN